MIEPDDIKQAHQNLSDAAARLDLLAETIQDHHQQISALEEQGATQATEHWREGKYLYLMHPTRDGKRKREYIGRDPAKVQAAQDRVDRYKKAEQHRKETDRLERQLQLLIDTAAALVDPGRIPTLRYRYQDATYRSY